MFSLCEEVCAGYLSLEAVVLIGSERNMPVVAAPLAFSLAELGQCRSVARQLSQRETRSRGCCTWMGSSEQLLPLPRHRGRGWLG